MAKAGAFALNHKWRVTMKPVKLLNAFAFTLVLTATSLTYAVDAVDRELANDRARVAATADRAESALAADRAEAAAALDRAEASTGFAATRTEAALAADRARVDATVDRAAAETGYAANRTAATVETATRNIVPWIIGIALVAAFLYWAMRRNRTTYVPPVDRVDRDATIPPVRPRNGTGTYNHP